MNDFISKLIDIMIPTQTATAPTGGHNTNTPAPTGDSSTPPTQPTPQQLPAPDFKEWIRAAARTGVILEIKPFVSYLKNDFTQVKLNLDNLKSLLTTDEQKASLDVIIQNMNFDIAVQVFDHVINLK